MHRMQGFQVCPQQWVYVICVSVVVSQEERWFSGELKKELDKVQGQLKQVIPFR